MTKAIDIYNEYKKDYSDTDRRLPFDMMADITDNQLRFKTTKATEAMLGKVENKRFTLRHYTVGSKKDSEPSFNQIASNYSLVHRSLKTLGGKGGNTNEKDWTKAGNSAFTFFLLAIDGEVNERKFLQSMTHFAEYDLENEALEAALGKGFESVEFFASPDVLDPKHSADLGAVPMVKGRLKDLKALLVGVSGVSAVQIGRMPARDLLNKIDLAFGGTLEIKIPGSVNVRTWHKKPPTGMMREP